MNRNLVVCLDGTAGQVRGITNSNPALVYRLLDHSDATRQIAYYDPGVGTFASPGAWSTVARTLSRLNGLIFGGGLRQNVGEAYLWIAEHWQPGDRLYIFGFSRGAFTARALTGMLFTHGVMRPGLANLVQYAVASYARPARERKVPWGDVRAFPAFFAQPNPADRGLLTRTPIEYLGLWDTVKAMGLARMAPKWPYTRKLGNALHIRHALAIDEKRRPFAEYAGPSESPEAQEEAWFTGVHTDVGGTPADDSSLSTIALKWVLQGAVGSGLLVNEKAVAKHFAQLSESSAGGKAHTNNPVWVLALPRHRRIPEGALIHRSVIDRMEAQPSYRPKLPSNYTVVDEDWGAAW